MPNYWSASCFLPTSPLGDSWHSTWTRRSSRPSRYLSPQCNSSTGAMQCDRVTKCTVGTILSSLAFWRFPFSAWNCIFLFSRTSKITCALYFSQPRGFAKRWWSFRSETAGKDRWKTNSCTEWLGGVGEGVGGVSLLVGFGSNWPLTYNVFLKPVHFFSCIHLIKTPQDVFAKRRLKLISLLLFRLWWGGPIAFVNGSFVIDLRCTNGIVRHCV